MRCWRLRRRIRDALHLFSCPRWPTLIRRPEVPCTPEKGSDRPCTSSLARIGDTAQSVRASDTSDCRYQHPPAMAAKFRSSPYERIYLFVLLLICFTPLCCIILCKLFDFETLGHLPKISTRAHCPFLSQTNIFSPRQRKLVVVFGSPIKTNKE